MLCTAHEPCYSNQPVAMTQFLAGGRQSHTGRAGTNLQVPRSMLDDAAEEIDVFILEA